MRSLGSSSNTKGLHLCNQVLNSTTARQSSQHVDYGIMRNAPANDKNGIRIRTNAKPEAFLPNPS